jgi:hypothetical protein
MDYCKGPTVPIQPVPTLSQTLHTQPSPSPLFPGSRPAPGAVLLIIHNNNLLQPSLPTII